MVRRSAILMSRASISVALVVAACSEPDDGPCSSAPYIGRRVVEDRNCLAREYEEFGCMRSMGCGDALTRAIDGQGTCWLLNNTCIPEGWTAFDDSSAEHRQECPEEAWSQCPP